jgi:serine phosphatase RsbU (regulator of sigma subunit)
MPPAKMVGDLRAMLEVSDEQLATMVYLVVKPALAQVAIINAGHPPPLLVRADGSASFVAGSLQPPLGAPCPGCGPALDPLQLRPGDTIVLYTDGLIEAPGTDIGQGLGRLAALAGKSSTASLGELCRRLIFLGLSTTRHRDDLTAVAARFGPLVNDPDVGRPGAVGADRRRSLWAGQASCRGPRCDVAARSA